MQAPGDGCYIVGGTLSNDFDCNGNHSGDSGISDVFVGRLDNSGNLLWHKDFGGTGIDAGRYACQDGKGGVLICGITNSRDGDITNYLGGFWVLDVDSSGNLIWDNSYGNAGAESPNSICKAIDGSIWIAGISGTNGGEIENAYGSDDAWFVHTDSVGNFINAKVLGSSQDDRGMMVYPLSNGNIIAGGFCDASNGSFSAIAGSPGHNAFLTVFEPQTTGVPNIISNESLRIFPNPAIEEFTLQVEEDDSCRVVVCDLIGRTMYEKNFVTALQIPVNDWNKGIYLIEVTRGANKIVQKLLVE